jgi:Flp pilus assembly protein TadG
VIVALSMLALIAMAALAIDVATLYVARVEAQRAADAAAMAGAKMFVTSGYTSYPNGYGTYSNLCNGSTGAADVAAQTSVATTLVAGVAPTVTTTCYVSVDQNPQFKAQVSRTNLPVFLARIWGITGSGVTATATAEAYNPSGTGGNGGQALIQVAGVKPMLLPDCPPSDASTANTNCAGGGAFYVDPSTGNIMNNGAFLGSTLTLVLPSKPGSVAISANGQGPMPAVTNGQYFFPLDIPVNPPSSSPPPPASCPSSGRPSCSGVGGGIYYDNVACFNPYAVKCGDVVGGTTLVPVDTRVNSGGSNLGQLQSRLDQSTQCLIHANNTGLSQGQDIISPFTPGEAALIQPGLNNPDASLGSAANISRSDSVITVPLFDGRNLCAGASNGSPACNFTAPIVGFLQLGITQDRPNGVVATVETVILNASGCNPNLTTTPISGGDVTPIPVRLVSH